MKRILSAVIAVLLILCLSIFAFATQYDLSSYTTADLIDLRQQVDVELSKRPDGGLIVPEGRYYVGTDIDAGSYTITVIKTDFLAGYNIYDAAGECIDGDILDDGEQARISVQDGTSFELYGSSFIIAKGGKLIF